MKNATELLGELLRIYDEPEKGGGELHSWVHQNVDDVREAIERGDDSERLDWIEASSDELIELFRPDRNGVELSWGPSYWPNREADPGSLRGAIDRARGEGE